jgi:hypothetical protein
MKTKVATRTVAAIFFAPLVLAMADPASSNKPWMVVLGWLILFGIGVRI